MLGVCLAVGLVASSVTYYVHTTRPLLFAPALDAMDTLGAIKQSPRSQPSQQPCWAPSTVSRLEANCGLLPGQALLLSHRRDQGLTIGHF